MTGFGIIMNKEWRFFIGSDRGVFILHLFLILSWSLMLVTPHEATFTNGSFWLVFFSVIVSANFANTVFIAERINGTMEILITSGISRKAILFGKTFFVLLTSSCIGFLCIGLATVWKHTIYTDSTFTLSANEIMTYLCAVFFNTSCGAYLSLRMNNPRLMNLVTILILAFVLSVYTALGSYFTLPDFLLPLILCCTGVMWTTLSLKLYESEKILQPVSL